MPTYFIRTPLPLDTTARAVFAEAHRAGTGNELAVLSNAAGTECLVKVNTASLPSEFMPVGFTPTEILEGVEAARALLNTPEWQAQP